MHFLYKTVLVETMAKDYFGHCYLCYSMGRILVSEHLDISERIKLIMQDLRMPLAWLTALSGVFYSIIKNPISIHETIEKHFKRKSYRGMLGIQNDLEQDLELLIKSVANNRSFFLLMILIVAKQQKY